MLADIVNRQLMEVWKFHPDAIQPEEGEIGVELEIEGANLPMTVTGGWSVKSEPSLRGGGLEYITKGAYPLVRLNKSLTILHKILTTDPVHVTYSNRESTHIHVNMQRVKIIDILGFILLFTMVEPILIRLCGEERNGNVFCLPTYETGDLPGTIRSWCYGMSVGSFTPRERGKYASLNIDPLRSFGSVEVRCFPLSIKPEQVLQWATWLLNIKQLIKDWPDKTFDTLFDYSQTHQEELLQTIFVGETQPPLFSQMHPTNIRDLLQLGVETAYEIHRGMDPVTRFTGKTMKSPAKKKMSFALPEGGVPPGMDPFEGASFTGSTASEPEEEEHA